MSQRREQKIQLHGGIEEGMCQGERSERVKENER